MYCGDETGAFIGDIGSHTARFGYGGEDCPKVVIPSAVYEHAPDENNNVGGSSQCNQKQQLGGKKRGAQRGKYTAPVSLMNVPPQSCFSSEGDEEDCNVGFFPIYQSMNSNHQKKQTAQDSCDDDGVIQDIDAWACLWEYSFSALAARGKSKHTVGYKKMEQSLDGPIDHPLLAVDSSNRVGSTNLQEKQKALMLETLFESLSAPAAYIAPSAMLSSFANGRQTSLIVDVGHTGSRVTPVVDGYLLHAGSCKSGRGGMWLGDVQRGVLEGCWKMNGSDNVVNKWNGWKGVPPCQHGGVIPRYILHSNIQQKLKASELEQLKRSPFHSMAVHEVMYEMLTSTSLQSFGDISDTSPPFFGYGSSENNHDVTMEDKNDDEEEDLDDDGPSYVLPDGTKIDLAQPAGKDLCRMPQLLLSEDLPSFIQPKSSDANDYASNMLPLHKLVHRSLSQILDADLRKELASNIILTGSASLFPGLDKSLSIELGKVLPASYKHKVISSKSTVENRYGAWIGGSILSSLGSFQQLWLSKKEYEENGAALGLQRFNNN
jgi:actin-like protein 6A